MPAQVHISYLEIYNELGYDLLDPEREIKAMEDMRQVRYCTSRTHTGALDPCVIALHEPTHVLHTVLRVELVLQIAHVGVATITNPF
jgi:hypothetical protein